MEFDPPKGVYLQIAEQVRERVLRGEWDEGERIPSIRELAVSLGVNPNTVTKSYQALTERRIIENRRGLGYFVAAGAAKAILREMKNEFVREDLPRVFHTMRLLGIGVDELLQHYERVLGEDPSCARVRSPHFRRA